MALHYPHRLQQPALINLFLLKNNLLKVMVRPNMLETLNNQTIKFAVSYGGRIAPRYPDAKLRYQGGDTRVLTVDRSISFLELWTKMVEMCGTALKLRCQLPNEDLDSLVTITSDEDLVNLIEEYDRMTATMAVEVTKIRAFLFSSKTITKVSPTSSSASSSTSITSPRSPFDSLNISPGRLASAPGQCIHTGSKPPAHPVFTAGKKVPYRQHLYRNCDHVSVTRSGNCWQV